MNSDISHGNCFQKHFAEDKTQIISFTSNHSIGLDKIDIDTMNTWILHVKSYLGENFFQSALAPRTQPLRASNFSTTLDLYVQCAGPCLSRLLHVPAPLWPDFCMRRPFAFFDIPSRLLGARSSCKHAHLCNLALPDRCAVFFRLQGLSRRCFLISTALRHIDTLGPIVASPGASGPTQTYCCVPCIGSKRFPPRPGLSDA